MDKTQDSLRCTSRENCHSLHGVPVELNQNSSVSVNKPIAEITVRDSITEISVEGKKKKNDRYL